MSRADLRRALEAAGIESAARDAQLLWREIEARGDRALAETFLDQRLARVPVSQILGRRAFWTHEFRVTADVLDPRPETETLVAAALEVPFRTVLDLGTGSGCILVSLLADRPDVCGVGIDLSPAALKVAHTNARDIGVADRATFAEGSWFEPVTDTFDLIVSNPPYIRADEMPRLAPEVRDHEPRMALTDEADGLAAYRAIFAEALEYLRPGGQVMVEFGAGQGPDVARIARVRGFDTTFRADLDGRDRVLVARCAE